MPPRLRRWRVNIFAVTWLSYAGYYFCRKTFGIVKKPLRDHMWPEDAVCLEQLSAGLVESCQTHDIEVAHIWTAFLVAYMCGQFMTAYLGRRVACRRLLIFGMAGSLIMNLVFGFLTLAPGASAYGWMMFVMMLNGLSQGTGWPGNVGLMAKWTRHHERGMVMGIWATCYQLGSILAKLFAAFMVGWLGLAWSFWGASAVLLTVWVIFFLLAREQPEDLDLPSMRMFEEVKETPDQAKKRSAGETAPPPDSEWRIWVVVVGMGLCYFCFKFVRYALDSWAPMFIEEGFDVTTSQAGYASTVFDWIGFLGVVVAGFASDKLFKSARIPVIFIMTVGMLIATILIVMVSGSSFVGFVFLLGLIGFMLMGPDSLLSGTAAMEVGSVRTAVIAAGVINGLGSIGPVVQEELIGVIKTNHGMDAVLVLLVVISALAVLGTGLLWFATRRLRVDL